MSLLHSAVGQFKCALSGGHIISAEEEARLCKSAKGEIGSHCSRCGVPVCVEKCIDKANAYIITERAV